MVVVLVLFWSFFSKFLLTCFFLIFAKNLHVSHVRPKPHAEEGLQLQS